MYEAYFIYSMKSSSASPSPYTSHREWLRRGAQEEMETENFHVTQTVGDDGNDLTIHTHTHAFNPEENVGRL